MNDEDETMYEHEDDYDVIAQALDVATAYERTRDKDHRARCNRCHESFLTTEDRYGICRQCVLENRA